MRSLKNEEDDPTYNVIDVWKKGITGQGVVVAVVDEGFDPRHLEIQGNYVSFIFNNYVYRARYGTGN